LQPWFCRALRNCLTSSRSCLSFDIR
jgi:hypothetical protein